MGWGGGTSPVALLTCWNIACKKGKFYPSKKKQCDTLSSCLCHCIDIDMIYLSNPHMFYKSDKLDSGGILRNKRRRDICWREAGGVIKQNNPTHFVQDCNDVSICLPLDVSRNILHILKFLSLIVNFVFFLWFFFFFGGRHKERKVRGRTKRREKGDKDSMRH